ncbi:class I SAM-dependent methyltransferase [Mesobacterium sp. TK19101]|uniref:Class I SAM-dependent methyltransferase n=1 Tax=Mesobacterium hydrothermale TaxID=3111907 RepID=A0ABU6HMA2_9RHOB|nr:class I SAM-dependent methyltransferase [Mesobacterium sp. TK19101]MEC3863001.1 class I SAM-dependent methyltransferase [Mesobacterium sp. TK19101]
MQDATFWDRAAARYAKSPIRDMDAYEHTLARVSAYLRPDMRGLELGCGTGSTALRLAPKVAELTATDFSPAMIDIARGKITDQHNLDFVVADPYHAPEGPFDVVMAFNLLHLLPNLESDLAQIHARLRPGGYLISKSVCLRDAQLWIRMIIPVLRAIGKAPYVSVFDIATLDDTIRRAGFEILETGVFPKKPPARFIVARRI